jgi:Fe2+ or Zn2+ uptake regulation protein
VAEVLDGENIHLTAETVHSRAQQLLPEISLATVYNTLNELVSMGEVIEVPGFPGAKRYDPNAHLPHHHFVCTACGELRDVFPSGEESLVLPGPELQGCEVRSVQIVFEGLCPACR